MASKVLLIKNFGQKIWIDILSRELINTNLLNKLINEDGITGMTTNPSILLKAIETDKSYQHDLEKIKTLYQTEEARLENLIIPDIKRACDIFLPIYNISNQDDGYVSFELPPYIANDFDKTIEYAMRFWEIINKNNLMIKIPATKIGIAALNELIIRGINVNMTLIFSLEQLIDTWQAYINGLQKRLQKGLEVKNIKSVVSFFLSRIDNAVDHKLPQHLQGKCAINLAKTAYLLYQETFANKIFEPLKAAGAMNQCLLFASTAPKNPKYSDVMYVENLIGVETINTLSEATLNAFKNHGSPNANLTKNIQTAPQIIQQIKQSIDLNQLGDTLQLEGLKIFETSYTQLLQLMK